MVVAFAVLFAVDVMVDAFVVVVVFVAVVFHVVFVDIDDAVVGIAVYVIEFAVVSVVGFFDQDVVALDSIVVAVVVFVHGIDFVVCVVVSAIVHVVVLVCESIAVLFVGFAVMHAVAGRLVVLLIFDGQVVVVVLGGFVADRIADIAELGNFFGVVVFAHFADVVGEVALVAAMLFVDDNVVIQILLMMDLKNLMHHSQQLLLLHLVSKTDVWKLVELKAVAYDSLLKKMLHTDHD